MAQESYTHRDLAGLLGVSETTVKSYRSKFPTFLPVAREGKPVRLHPESLAVCRRIREHFGNGLTIVQTADRLRLEFKEFPLNRRLSTSLLRNQAETGGEGLAARLEALALAQDQTAARMERLEAEVRNLATLEAASKSLVAELLAELRTARPAPAAAPPPQPAPVEPLAPQRRPEAQETEPAAEAGTVVTARKIVTVHGQAGPVASYALGREPRPEPPFAPQPGPDQAFLDLPVVIRSDRGDFLGLPGGQSVGRLVELLAEGGSASWLADGPEAWNCETQSGPAQTRELSFERTTTPRGNLVGLIRRLRTMSGDAVQEAAPAEVQTFFRQVLDLLGA